MTIYVVPIVPITAARLFHIVHIASSASALGPNPFKMDPMADAAWTIVFSLMIISAIAGNLVVFWIVLGKPTTIDSFT
jgi:hypothetical protein